MSGTKRAVQSVSIPVLWMDDEPDAIVRYVSMLNSEPSEIRLEVEIASSISEARDKLKIGNYAAFVADCMMDKYDAGVNGAEFLTSVNETRKDLPTFVYSAWLDDPRFVGYLDRSLAIMKEDKEVFDPPLHDNELFACIYKIGKRYLQVKDLQPETIQFKQYIKNPSQYMNEAKAHWQKHGHWIEIEMRKRGYSWCVVCEYQIVEGSEDLFDFPNEDRLNKIGLENNRIPFAYSDTLLPESVSSVENPGPGDPWSGTTIVNDYYPKIRARINNVEIVDDFDTGSPQTFVSDKVVKKGVLSFFRSSEKGYILGSSFDFSTIKVKLALLDSSGVEQIREIPVAVVEGWDGSAFKERNADRRILYGRDLLRAFEVEVCLDSQKRVTRVRFLKPIV